MSNCLCISFMAVENLCAQARHVYVLNTLYGSERTVVSLIRPPVHSATHIIAIKCI